MNDKIFYSSLIITFIVLSLIIYISYVQPSKEEFAEVYWQVFKSEDLTAASQVNCSLVNCSKSGFHKGTINLNGKNFGIITTDLDKLLEYKYTCIDFNNNNTYCEKTEGPFKNLDSFFIGNDGYSILEVLYNNVFVIHYPKNVTQQNFIVGFVVKSHYAKTMEFRATLVIDSTQVESKIITLNPNEEAVSNFNIILPTKGSHKVQIIISSLEQKSENEIGFFVNRLD